MTAEEFPVNPLVKAFYEMLDRVGLSPSGSFAYRRAEEINASLEGPLKDFPIGWMPGIEQYILDKGVTQIDTILTAMTAALKRGVPPNLPLAAEDRNDEDPFAPWRRREPGKIFDGWIEWSHSMPDEIVEMQLERVERRPRLTPSTQQLSQRSEQ